MWSKPLASLYAQVRKLSPCNQIPLDDVWADISRVGTALSIEQRSAELIESLVERMNTIKRQSGSLRHRPRVAFIRVD